MLAKSEKKRLFHSLSRFCKTIWSYRHAGSTWSSLQSLITWKSSGIYGAEHNVKETKEIIFLGVPLKPLDSWPWLLGEGSPETREKERGSQHRLQTVVMLKCFKLVPHFINKAI